MGQVGGLWAVELCSFHLVPHQGPPSTCWERVELRKEKGPKLKANGVGEGLKQAQGSTPSPGGAKGLKEQKDPAYIPTNTLSNPHHFQPTPLVC